ncbi:MAG TPA: hypothetical protein VEX86_12220 [Longimicrobium sp.]|nr:hypothetical protein [Longimicrobium sp.]
MKLGYRLGPNGVSGEEINAYADERELERLRRTIRAELDTHPGQEALAREMRVGRLVIRKFVEQRARPTPANLQKIRDWAENRPPMWTPYGAVILATAVRDLPGDERARVRRHLAQALADGYRRAGVTVPAWLQREAA